MSDYGLERGAVELQSIGPIAFGPGDVLFVGDNGAASILAIDVGDGGHPDSGPADAFELDDLDGKLAALLNCRTDDVVIRDMAVHPGTHDVYLSVVRGTGDDAVALIVRVDHRDGTVSDLDLTDVASSRVSITNAPGKDAYPISAMTFILIYQQQSDPTKGKKLIDFLKWAIHDGQASAAKLDYAPLPKNVVAMLDKRLSTVKTVASK